MARSVTGNRGAFLDTLAWSEGTTRVQDSDDGYNVEVGGTLFGAPPDCYADHPRQLVHLNAHLESTAAGRYQLLERYFDAYKAQLGIIDFSPASQDAIAIQQIRERSALQAIDAGRFDDAISLVSNIWASLPGASYGQPENSLDDLRRQYLNAGGTLA